MPSKQATKKKKTAKQKKQLTLPVYYSGSFDLGGDLLPFLMT